MSVVHTDSTYVQLENHQAADELPMATWTFSIISNEGSDLNHSEKYLVLENLQITQILRKIFISVLDACARSHTDIEKILADVLVDLDVYDPPVKMRTLWSLDIPPVLMQRLDAYECEKACACEESPRQCRCYDACMKMFYKIPESTKWMDSWERVVNTALRIAIPEEYYEEGTFKTPAKDLHCPVCMAEFNEEDTLRRLPCQHTFHNECILTWMRVGTPTRNRNHDVISIMFRMYSIYTLQKRSSCPLCRGKCFVEDPEAQARFFNKILDIHCLV